MPPVPRPSRRPPGRPRSDAARRAVLAAAVGLVGRGGYRALSMEALAREAGVSKQTIYRWWPSPAAAVLEALVEGASAAAPSPDRGTLAADLQAFAQLTVRAVERNAALLAGLMAHAQLDPEFGAAFRKGFLAERRAVLTELLERHRERGTVHDRVDLALVVDIAFGTLWYRVLGAHAPLDDGFADGLAATLLDLCGEATSARRARR